LGTKDTYRLRQAGTERIVAAEIPAPSGFARLLGLRVVMTHHCFDYEPQKWGRLAKAMLRERAQQASGAIDPAE
jgi:hypothetical protein